MKHRSSAFLIAAAAVLIWHGAYASPISVARGKRIAEDNCAPCHAIGRAGTSPNPDSTPFKTLSQARPGESLEETFAHGMQAGHGGMPMFVAPTEQIQDLLAYLQSVQIKTAPEDH